MRIEGGCHCGAISFEAEVDPARSVICHCIDCQNLTGSAYRVTIPAAAANFKLHGAPAIYRKTTADNGAVRRHAFCPTCGTPIYATEDNDQPAGYGIRVGAIKQRAALAPHFQIWRRSALEWAMEINHLPSIDTQT